MRAFISQTWSEYRDKKIDLMNAAVVTDGALQKLTRVSVGGVIVGDVDSSACLHDNSALKR